jgi:hypothetical protein
LTHEAIPPLAAEGAGSITLTSTETGLTAYLSSSFHEGAWVSVPIEVAAGESVTIVVRRIAGINAVLSGVFLG